MYDLCIHINQSIYYYTVKRYLLIFIGTPSVPSEYLTMDPFQNWAQDVLRCDICETPVPPLYCDNCLKHLCKLCVGEHLINFSKEHKVVPFVQRGFVPKCSIHHTKLCELHCEQCDISICTLCVSTGEHLGHTLIDFTLKSLETKKIIIQKDLDELNNFIFPKYKEIASIIPVQKAEYKLPKFDNSYHQTWRRFAL